MSDELLTTIDGGVATVTMNRPEARNALNRSLRRQLWDTMGELEADDDVAVVVLTGADPGFCSGMDLKEFAAAGDSGVHLPEAWQGGLLRFFAPMTKPVIGAVNGVAVTGGLELALQCTFLIASDRARFSDTHARVGLQPGGGMTVLLPQAVGLRKAIELTLRANFLTADDALAAGLVNHVVAHDQLMPFTMEIAREIAANDQRAVRVMLETYQDVADAPTVTIGHFLEGGAFATWQMGDDDMAERARVVTERGRSLQS